MMHGGPATQVDVKSLANSKYKVIFHGVSAHAAIKPEKGRSALDALILAFQGIEFLREHVNSDVKIHYRQMWFLLTRKRVCMSAPTTVRISIPYADGLRRS